MTIMTSDGEQFVSIGSTDIWNSLYSTLVFRIEGFSDIFFKADAFFKTCSCSSADALKTAYEIDSLRKALSVMSLDKAVYDIRNPEKPIPWSNNLSKSIVSCDKLYTTEDGQNLLVQVTQLLEYAGENGLSIMPA